MSLAGLVAEADFHPASSPQGRTARARLAYTIAAGRAAQQGNRGAYQRAMRNLEGLGGLGIFTSSDPALTQRASTAVTAAVTRASAGVSIPAALSGASQYVNLVAAVASLGTSIARSACNGCDTNAISAIETVISWVRAILTGSAPTLPTLGPNELNGFVQFCTIKDAVWNILDPILQAAITGMRAAAVRDAGLGQAADVRDAGLGQAADVLDLLRQRIGTMFNGICTAVASQMPPVDPGAACATAGAVGPNWVFDPATNTCNCAPGYTSSITPNQCVPIPPARPGVFYRPPPPSVPIMVTMPIRPPSGGGSGGGSSGGGVLLPLAAAALAAKFLLF